MSSRYISTDSGLWGCGLPVCLLLPSFFLGCFVPRCSEIYNWLLTIIVNYMKELHGLPWEFGEKCTYWVFCQIISNVLYKGICLEIIHYVLNQIVISVCPLSELSLVKPLKYAAASDWNLLQKEIKLQNLVSYNYFKSLLCNLESNLTVCNCFQWVICWFCNECRNYVVCLYMQTRLPILARTLLKSFPG